MLALALLGCLMSTGFVLFGLIEESARFHYSLSLILKVFVLRVPEMLYYTLPMSILMGSMLTVARLAADQEWLTLRLLGLSFWRLSLPFLGVATLLSTLGIVLNETLAPTGSYLAQEFVTAAQQGKVRLPRRQFHLFLRELENQQLKHLIYAREAREGVLYDVVVQRFVERQLRFVLQAKTATLEGEQWVFSQGNTLDLQGNQRATFGTYTLALSKALPGLLNARQQPQHMNARQLSRHIHQLQTLGQDTHALIVRWHQKFALPLAAIPFALLGIILGSRTVRSRSQGLGVSLLLVFGYYLIMSLGTALGDSGQLQPWLAAWLPHIVLMPIIFMLMQLRNQRG